MKIYNKFIAVLAAGALLAGGFSSCQDDIDAPQQETPVAVNVPNTSILELKQTFWDDATNYIWNTPDQEDATPSAIPAREDGSHYIISGRVISSDEDGNVFKSLVIQDETAALAISINSYNLYLNYRRGQEVVLDVTGMYMGKYNGLLQLGYPEWYANGSAWEASFMAPEFFRSHVELNGDPELAQIDTLQVNAFSELPSDPDGLMKWQSQMVRFNNVEFSNGGSDTFSTYHSSGVNQSIVDADGSSLSVRTSGYSNFWNKTLPAGKLDVAGILSYYGTSGWQLILIDYEGCMNIGSPTLAKGSESNPWTVDDAVEVEQGSTTPSGWVTGYIVGAVGPEVSSVTSNDDIEWVNNPILNNTLVIGQSADTRDIAHALVVELPYGSKLRELGNLVDHPENFGRQIWINGTLAKVLDTYGVTGNTGVVGTWRIEGVDTSDYETKEGTGTESDPFSVQQVININPTSTTDTDYSGVWVKGYIVGWADMSSEYYINANTARFTTPATMATNLLMADDATETDVTKCIGVQLPSGSVRSALNLVNNPGNLGKAVQLQGDILKYSGVPGVKNTSAYILDGSSTPDTPTGDAVTALNQDFENLSDIPSGWSQVQVAGTKTWYVTSYNSNYYASMTGYEGTAPFDSWLLTPAINIANCADKKLSFDTQVNGYSSTTSVFEVYVLNSNNPSTATVKQKLTVTLAEAPASGYSGWVSSGEIDLSSYSGNIYIGFRYYATQDDNYATWCLDNVKLNADGAENGGDDNGSDNNGSDDSTTEYKGDFNSFNGGTPKSSPYTTYTNSTGWTAENSIILSGTDGTDNNPYFTFIGGSGVLAPTLNGKSGSCGRLYSPVLTGGCKTLSFKYGFAFTETKCSFQIDVKDSSGNVLKTDTVTLTSITKLQAYDYSLDVNVTGDFIIEITNLGLSQSSSNKDRVSIWNLTWTN